MRRLSIQVRNFCVPWTYTRQELMRTLRIRISSLCAFSVCASVFHIFQMLILYTLSSPVRNRCVHWAWASETDAYTEHTCQELIRALSIYASGTGMCTEHMRALNAVWNLKRSLKNVLRIRVKCWCVPWAVYASGTDVFAEHTRQECSYFDHWHFLRFCKFVEQQDKK